MQDWLGKELNVGDKVLYPAGSGRSITMIIGEIVEFKDNGSVRIQPLNSSRWKQHYGTDYYVDTRTGKRIDPWKTYEQGTHFKSKGYYQHKATGNVITAEEHQALRGNTYFEYDYVSAVFQDWVKQRNDGPKPVTISVTENLTKWEAD